MKINTKYPTNILSKWKCFLGAMLTVAFMLPSTAVSQSSPAPVDLGTAGDFVILTKAGITDVPASAVTGDVGISPITGAANGLTCTEVTGNVYSVDAAGPAPCNIMDATRLTAAIGDMETAYTDAAGRSNPDFTELGAGEIGGLTLVPGLYKWGTDVLITTDVTLNGGPNDVWIFQIAGGITMANGKSVILTGGSQPKNIFWQSSGVVWIGTTAHFEGIILCQTAINLKTGASINGRLFAQTSVTLEQNAVTKPTSVTAVETELTPQEFALFQNYPNPFNPSTRIQYSLEKAAEVTLRVYNLLGLEVATLVNGHQEAGSYAVPFNTNKGTLALSSGVYFYRLEAGSFVSTRKLVLIK